MFHICFISTVACDHLLFSAPFLKVIFTQTSVLQKVGHVRACFDENLTIVSKLPTLDNQSKIRAGPFCSEGRRPIDPRLLFSPFRIPCVYLCYLLAEEYYFCQNYTMCKNKMYCYFSPDPPTIRPTNPPFKARPVTSLSSRPQSLA